MQIDHPISLAAMRDVVLIEGAKKGCFANVYARVSYAEPDFLEHAVACVNALEGYNPDAVRDVVEAAKAMLPTNVSLNNPNIRDRHTLPVDIEVGALRKLAAALARLEGGAS